MVLAAAVGLAGGRVAGACVLGAWVRGAWTAFVADGRTWGAADAGADGLAGVMNCSSGPLSDGAAVATPPSSATPAAAAIPAPSHHLFCTTASLQGLDIRNRVRESPISLEIDAAGPVVHSTAYATARVANAADAGRASTRARSSTFSAQTTAKNSTISGR